jgi:phosphatidate cytidylyltransferase
LRFGSDLRQRVISGFLLAATAAIAVVLGGWVNALFVALGTGVMAWELTRMTRGVLGFRKRGAILAFITGALPPIVVEAAGIWPALAVALVSSVITGFFLARKTARPELLALGILLLACAGAFFVWMRDLPEKGLLIAIWLALIVAAADMGGYFAGRAIGGPKLAPTLSPNKTWAGAIGGIVFAMIVSATFALIVRDNIYVLVPLAAITAITSQAGDLVESATKRRFGVKDSSALIPGHGGVLDRFDALAGASLFVGLTLALFPVLIAQW